VCRVFFERGSTLCGMCIFVLCIILVPLPLGKTPFAVQLNNNNNNIGRKEIISQLCKSFLARKMLKGRLCFPY
jgi:hypothetical protein